MRIGLIAGATAATGTSLQDIVESSKTAEQRGFDNIWVANTFGFDAIGAIAISLLSRLTYYALLTDKSSKESGFSIPLFLSLLL